MTGGSSAKRPSSWLSGPISSIGPELISGAADNDPTNVGTAAVVGAQTGYQLSWAALLTGPMLYVVLDIAAQVGVRARSDLQSLTLRRFGRRVAGLLLISVVSVNVVTIAADLQAGAAGVGLLTGISPRWLVLPLGAALAGLLLIGQYRHLAGLLRYLLPGFLAFAAAAILARPDWPALIESSFVPTLSLRGSELTGAVALTGTTLTSYVYVWETVQRGVEAAQQVERDGLARARAGAAAAGFFTALTLWSMLIASAATLGRHHEPASSAQDAARALRPLAGALAGDLFAAGLIISAIVALPVLVASTAHVVGAQFDWRRGLGQRVGRARRFYAVLVAPLVLAAAASLAGIPVLATLVAASVLGGLATPVGIVVLILLARDGQTMRGQPVSRRLAAAGWVVAVVVGGLGLLLLLAAAASAL